MSRILVIGVSLGLLFSGSVVAQPAPYPQPYPQQADPQQPYPQQGYSQQGYPPPDAAGLPQGYPPPGPPPAYAYGAAPAYPGQPYVAPDGLTYVNGVPVYYAYGSYLPLVFVAGFGWGYYGPGHQWFGAPAFIGGRLDHFYPGGRGFLGRPGGGYGQPGGGFARPGGAVGHPGFRPAGRPDEHH